MVKQFVRRNGKTVPFRPAKMKRSIMAAAKDAHLPAARARALTGKVSRAVLRSIAKRKTVRAAVLRKKVLGHLDKMAPAAAKAWRAYDRRRRMRRRR
jgi:transcriptional regulator NrdR family protein